MFIALIQASDADLMRFHIRRIRSGHQAPPPVLLAVPPAMKCIMAELLSRGDCEIIPQSKSGQPKLTAAGVAEVDYSPALSMITLGQSAKASGARVVTLAGIYT